MGVGQSLGVLGGVMFVLGYALAALGLGSLAAARGRTLAWGLLSIIPVLGPLAGYSLLRRYSPALNAPLDAIRGAVSIMLVGALFWTGWSWLYEGQTKEIHGDAPESFPMLLVVRSDKEAELSAFVVQQRDLAKFTREHPAFSFHVPDGLAQTLKERLRYYSESGEFKLEEFEPPGYFRVKWLGPDRQQFEVRYPIHEESHITGWYEATATGIEPRRYRFWHDMAIGFIGMFATFFALLVYAPLAWALKRYFWSRWRSPQPED